MKLNNIQYRILLTPQFQELKEFTFKGIKFKVLRESEHTNLIPNHNCLPIGVVMTGTTRQYVVEDEVGNQYEAYVYYYRKIEGGYAAILDALEEVNNEKNLSNGK